MTATCFYCLRPNDSNCNRSCSRCTPLSAAALAAVNMEILAWLQRFFPEHKLGYSEVVAAPIDAFPTSCRGLTTMSFVGAAAKVRIMVPNDSPRFAVSEALAHEYGHVLLCVDPVTFSFIGLPTLTDEDQEGFCELLRAQWLRDFPPHDLSLRLSSIEDNQIALYRLGYRRMLPQLAAARSIPALRNTLLGIGASPTVPRPTAPQSLAEGQRPLIRLGSHDSIDTPLVRKATPPRTRPTIRLDRN